MPRPTPIPPDIAGDVLALVQEVVFLGQKCQFSSYYRNNIVAPTRGDAQINVQAVCNAWVAVIHPVLLDTLSDGTFATRVTAWSMRWPDVARGSVGTPTAVGTRAGDPLPPQIAMVISKHTGLRGKSGRGRLYLCGMSEADSTNGAPTVPYLNVVNTLANSLATPMNDPGTGRTYVPVVVSLTHYAQIDPVPIAGPFWRVPGSDIIECDSNNVWFTQRRRTIGKGQ